MFFLLSRNLETRLATTVPDGSQTDLTVVVGATLAGVHLRAEHVGAVQQRLVAMRVVVPDPLDQFELTDQPGLLPRPAPRQGAGLLGTKSKKGERPRPLAVDARR